MDLTIKIILVSGITTMCLFGFMYFIVCLASGRNRRRGFKILFRTIKSHIPRRKPTLPSKESDWDDIDVPMR